MAKETEKPAEGDAKPITAESVQAEIESLIQEKLNDVQVGPADLQRVLQLLHKLTKLIPKA